MHVSFIHNWLRPLIVSLSRHANLLAAMLAVSNSTVLAQEAVSPKVEGSPSVPVAKDKGYKDSAKEPSYKGSAGKAYEKLGQTNIEYFPEYEDAEYSAKYVPGKKHPDSIRYYGPGRSGSHWDSAKYYNSETWVNGRDTWWFFTGGTENFYRALSVRLAKLDVSVEFFRLLDSRRRNDRFKQLGLINEPNFKEATQPDEFGLWLDVPHEQHPENPEWKTNDRHPPDPYYPVDEANYGLPTGIVGFRMFRNPRFTENQSAKWKSDFQKWWKESDEGKKVPKDPSTTNPVATYMKDPGKVEPPYLVGITCAFCHVAFDPTNPPLDPAKPRWENLSANIGNQYLREGDLFFGWGRTVGGDAHPIKGKFELDPYQTEGLKSDNLLYQYGQTQQSGTSETSRFSYDFINNPNTVNQIFYVGQRSRFYETAPNGKKVETFHVLKDGADSVGVPAALARVFVNIGGESEYWLSRLWNPLEGTGPHPLSIAELTMDDSVPEWRKVELAEKIPSTGKDWKRIVERMPSLATYLMSYNAPFTLEDAVDNEVRKLKECKDDVNARILQLEGLKSKPEKAREGAKIFARYCAKCHSNKQPSYPLSDKDSAAFYMQSVLSDDFRAGNTLTNDQRYPVTLIGTNAQRAFATNAIEGEIWAEFSSQEYKSLPSVGTLRFQTPLNELSPAFGNRPISTSFVAPGGGRGYYRTASLTSLWTSAPYLHNNSVGTDPYRNGGFANDVFCVERRVEAFDDGIRKLLGLTPRAGAKSIKVTSIDSTLFSGLDRTKRRVKADALWVLIQPIAKSIIEKKINGVTEDPVVRQVLMAAAEKGLRQVPEQLPELFEKLTANDQYPRLKEQLKAQLTPVLKQFLIPAVEGKVQAALQKLGYSEELSKNFSNEFIDTLEEYGDLGAFIEEAKVPGGGPANLFLTTIPQGTPLNLVLNQSISSAPYAVQTLLVNKDDKRKLAEELLRLSDCPDIVEDHGHNFPTKDERERDAVTAEDMENLIEFLKTL